MAPWRSASAVRLRCTRAGKEGLESRRVRKGGAAFLCRSWQLTPLLSYGTDLPTEPPAHQTWENVEMSNIQGNLDAEAAGLEAEARKIEDEFRKANMDDNRLADAIRLYVQPRRDAAAKLLEARRALQAV